MDAVLATKLLKTLLEGREVTTDKKVDTQRDV